MAEGAMTAFLGNISDVVTQAFTWIGTVGTTITGSPILLFSVGFFALGVCISLFKSLIHAA